MSAADKTLLQDARQWIEQEAVWDDTLLATRGSVPAPRVAVVSPTENKDKATALQALYEEYKTCTRCPLGTTRLEFVFGVGNPDARVMFIGEGPGYAEDHRGEPFVGPAGQLLDKIMESIGLSRKTVYIANIVKCHAMVNPQDPESRGNDRPPNTEEVETCSPILQQQIAIIQPEVIVTLGSPATRAILQTSDGITKLRGKLVPLSGTYLKPGMLADDQVIQVMPTYHPAALLRNPDLKKDTWTDMKLLRSLLHG